MKIKYLVMDVDGTLTDGKLYVGKEGELLKCFDVKDGYGIKNILPKAEITPIIISGRRSESTRARCNELGIKIIREDISDKKTELENIITNLSDAHNEKDIFASVAYIGDDVPDLPCIELVNRYGGITGCPANAVQEVKDSVKFVSAFQGGNGAVREFIEYIGFYCAENWEKRE